MGKAIGKKQPGRSRYTWEKTVKIDLKKLDGKARV